MRSDRTLRKWYKIFNRKWFGDKLPPNTWVGYSEDLVEEAKRRPTYGEMEWHIGTGQPPEIRINPILREQGWVVVAAETLLHEMVHIWKEQNFDRGSDHGIQWQKKMQNLAKRGAFGRRNGVLNTDLW